MDDEEAAVKVTPHRRKNPQACERCKQSYRRVDAEWNVTPPGGKIQYLCEPHARYWSAFYGAVTFPADK